MAKKVGRGADQFALRFPSGMRDAIKALAEQHERSMNSELIHALEVYLQTQEQAQRGWKMMPPEFVVGDDYQSMLQAIAKETNMPVKEVLCEAIRRDFSLQVTDAEERERRIRDLTGEILDLVRYDLERDRDD